MRAVFNGYELFQHVGKYGKSEAFVNVCEMRIWERGSSRLIKIFGRFLWILSDKTVPSLKCSALVVCLVHAVLLISTKKYKKWLIRERHWPIILILWEYVKYEYMIHAEISRSRESVYRTSMSRILDAEHMILLSSDADRERGR